MGFFDEFERKMVLSSINQDRCYVPKYICVFVIWNPGVGEFGCPMSGWAVATEIGGKRGLDLSLGLNPDGIQIGFKAKRVIVAFKYLRCWQVDDPAIVRGRRFAIEGNIVAITMEELELMDRKERFDLGLQVEWGGGHRL